MAVLSRKQKAWDEGMEDRGQIFKWVTQGKREGVRLSKRVQGTLTPRGD